MHGLLRYVAFTFRLSRNITIKSNITFVSIVSTKVKIVLINYIELDYIRKINRIGEQPFYQEEQNFLLAISRIYIYI